MTSDEIALLVETHRINYRLRSTFFYRKLKEYNTLLFPFLIEQLFPVEHLYHWDSRQEWGIGEDAFNYIKNHPELHIFEVFLHPKLLIEHPRLLAYYRNIAALSQKSVKYLAGIEVKRIENDTENLVVISSDQATHLARLFNEHTTLIVDASIQTLSKAELYGILLTSTGAQIDGSWRNAIGEEAEKVIQRLLINDANERHVLGGLLLRNGTSIEPYDPSKIEEQLGNVHKYRGFLLTNGTSILFSSEPDISLLDKNGLTIAAIEVKGGSDPAGALERYGAAKKSFGESRRLNPTVSTILIASCITPEVHTRIKNDPLISRYLNLTELLKPDNQLYTHFMNEVFSLLGYQIDI